MIKVDKGYKPNFELIFTGICLNECSNNPKVFYRFSDAKTGKSGYSFGRSQFDVSHNPSAVKFLKEVCGFTDLDIIRLKRKDKNIGDLNEKLGKFKSQIDDLDRQHLQKSIDHVMSLERLPLLESDKTFAHLVDYHNQFNLSRNGKMHKWLKSRNEITSEDILEFKLNQTLWGKKYPSDVKRRYYNIEKL